LGSRGGAGSRGGCHRCRGPPLWQPQMPLTPAEWAPSSLSWRPLRPLPTNWRRGHRFGQILERNTRTRDRAVKGFVELLVVSGDQWRENCTFTGPNNMLCKINIPNTSLIKIACFGCYFYESNMWDGSFVKHVIWTAKNTIFSTSGGVWFFFFHTVVSRPPPRMAVGGFGWGLCGFWV
jgi:hypothetical protein